MRKSKLKVFNNQVSILKPLIGILMRKYSISPIPNLDLMVTLFQPNISFDIMSHSMEVVVRKLIKNGISMAVDINTCLKHPVSSCKYCNSVEYFYPLCTTQIKAIDQIREIIPSMWTFYQTIVSSDGILPDNSHRFLFTIFIQIALMISPHISIWINQGNNEKK